MKISVDDLTNPKVLGLLQHHLDTMAPTAPEESRHALDLSGLKSDDVTFWAVWEEDDLAGFGALKELADDAGEIKSMRTSPAYLNRGVAKILLSHIEAEARKRGYAKLFLETGSMAFFEPARKLYHSFGYRACEPFANYRADLNSVFMSKVVAEN